MTMSRNCKCGHPWSHHLIVKGHECAPGVTVNGHSVIPDIWVCSGDPDHPYLGPDASPWDYVCGCVLHHAPPLVAA